MQKTAFQKMVEKALMLERNDRLSLMPVMDNGKVTLVVGISRDTGFTPLARMLSKVEIDSLTPLMSKLGEMENVMDQARADLPGVDPDEFIDLPLHKAMDWEAIDRIGFSE